MISIIGLLSSIVLTSVNSARVKARDARRKADLDQLRTALELYYDSNGTYPVTGVTWFSSEPNNALGNNGGNWIPGLAPTYIPTLPHDPRAGVGVPNPPCSAPWLQAYLYRSDTGASYKLLSHCAPEGAWTSSDGFYDPVRPTWAWKVCSGDPTACNTW